jgi:hypothetical protein
MHSSGSTVASTANAGFAGAEIARDAISGAVGFAGTLDAPIDIFRSPTEQQEQPIDYVACIKEGWLRKPGVFAQRSSIGFSKWRYFRLVANPGRLQWSRRADDAPAKQWELSSFSDVQLVPANSERPSSSHDTEVHSSISKSRGPRTNRIALLVKEEVRKVANFGRAELVLQADTIGEAEEWHDCLREQIEALLKGQ